MLVPVWQQWQRPHVRSERVGKRAKGWTRRCMDSNDDNRIHRTIRLWQPFCSSILAVRSVPAEQTPSSTTDLEPPLPFPTLARHTLFVLTDRTLPPRGSFLNRNSLSHNSLDGDGDGCGGGWRWMNEGKRDETGKLGGRGSMAMGTSQPRTHARSPPCLSHASVRFRQTQTPSTPPTRLWLKRSGGM
ncbi:hypothetical protein IE53DRAFT_25158 [Violaceomyces palustris]|uniref:Uncharacterized protein n=1 Tax=Violaceomyces palustris TaxID=1673888 RepID=A0ACD0P1R1_9BASI|nr:hypothetical protein IE53DRAFT_25158 [Violaceomyces palustris]